MTFKNRLNEYLNNINCSSKELSIKSNVSESVISRYRNGDRTPKIDSKQLKDIAAAIECIIKEKNIEEYLNTNILFELSNAIKEMDTFNYDSFSNNLNELITTLKININEMSKYIMFDSSHISRIKNGKTRPSDPILFANRICNYITSKYNSLEYYKTLSLLLDKDVNENNIYDLIFNYLTNDTNNNKNYIGDFLNNLNNFNLNDYIKDIKFDELKVPNIPFYKAKTKNYYGLEEMKNAEIDFFKATVLTKNNEDIFMCSDMPMEDMAKDIEFGKKWMFGVAMCLKKGLHLNIIHNLDRPFNEMMLGLESWIPIYMTGQISPYYLKETKNSIYGHLNYTSGKYILYGECIKDYHDKGKYYLTSDNKEVKYYKEKASYILKKANSLMDIYTEKDKNSFKTFLLNDTSIKTNRKRILSSLPLFTMNDELLNKILIRNNLSNEEIVNIKNYKKDEENNIKEILKNNIITDTIYDYSDSFNDNLSLSLENIFLNRKITYTYKEYIEHLNNTKNYKNKNYHLITTKEETFSNISITILENDYVIISKISNPVIHFVIKHPKLVSAISNFKPLIKEK
ncbi:MAG: helix-turn-helix domain-containing protein [Bacillales bacterium]|nr:helix-turn-helix domain-containing protein [Bacillales bacterium]